MNTSLKKKNMYFPSIYFTHSYRNITKSILSTFILLLMLNSGFSQCEYKSAIAVDELQIGNMITWVTVQEKDNDKFIIQKSNDGITFKIVGEVKGALSSNEETKYRYLDTSLGDNKAFYRLIQIDRGGIEHYSPTVIINRKMDNHFLLTGMSSPLTDSEFSCSLRSNFEGEMTLNLINSLTEELIETKQWPVVKGLNLVTLDLEKYPNATYELDFILIGEKESIVINKVETGKVPNIDFVVKE